MTGFGHDYLRPSAAVARGRILAVSPLPGGPGVARFEVERWVLTPAAPPSGKTIAVSIPAETLEAGEQALLAFLGPPERRDSVLWPLVAVTRASDEDLTAIESWIGVEASAAALPSFEARVALVKPALLRGLASPHAGLRSMALYEMNRWCEFDDPLYSIADVKTVEGLAVSTKREDAQRALKLLDLAERMRARARR